MSLADWDRDIAPHIAGIRLDAGWIGFYAAKIEERLRKLRFKPEFATEAEAKLTEAIPELERALLSLKESRDVFRAMQVGKN